MSSPDAQSKSRGLPGRSPGPPETHTEPPGAALDPPGSPLGGHGVAQTAKVVILLKLSLILMNFGSPRVPPNGILFVGRRRRRQPLYCQLSPTFDLLYTSATAISASLASRTAPTHLNGARPDLRRLRRQPAAHRKYY